MVRPAAGSTAVGDGVGAGVGVGVAVGVGDGDGLAVGVGVGLGVGGAELEQAPTTRPINRIADASREPRPGPWVADIPPLLEGAALGRAGFAAHPAPALPNWQGSISNSGAATLRGVPAVKHVSV